jgi:rubredoxin
MGKFRDQGDPSLVLMEEMAEAIQVIAKKHRFEGEWNGVPQDKTETRWEMLQAEMADVFYQWFRLKEQVMGKVIVEEEEVNEPRVIGKIDLDFSSSKYDDVWECHECGHIHHGSDRHKLIINSTSGDKSEGWLCPNCAEEYWGIENA